MQPTRLDVTAADRQHGRPQGRPGPLRLQRPGRWWASPRDGDSEESVTVRQPGCGHLHGPRRRLRRARPARRVRLSRRLRQPKFGTVEVTDVDDLRRRGTADLPGRARRRRSRPVAAARQRSGALRGRQVGSGDMIVHEQRRRPAGHRLGPRALAAAGPRSAAMTWPDDYPAPAAPLAGAPPDAARPRPCGVGGWGAVGTYCPRRTRPPEALDPACPRATRLPGTSSGRAAPTPR